MLSGTGLSTPRGSSLGYSEPMNTECLVGVLCLVGAGILGTWVLLAVAGALIQLLPVIGVVLAVLLFWRALRWLRRV